MMGGSEANLEPENINIPRLPLFKSMHSPEPSGVLTPPLHTLASVPFGWEEEPGKPRPCTTQGSLELPQRLLLDAKLRKLPSPPIVLDGPCEGTNSYHSPSFRMSEDCYGSDDSSSAERKQLGTMVLSKGVGNKEKGWFASWRYKAFKVKREGSGGSHVFPSSADRDTDHVGTIGGSLKNVRRRRVKRSGSFPNLSHAKPGVWTTIREGLKHVVPWRSEKLRKDGYGSLRL